MGSRTARITPGPPDVPAGITTYRAELCRKTTPGHASKYYDGGDFSPYCMESLIDLLRFEAQAPYESMGLTLELRGRCSAATLRELARRFGEIEAPNIRVNIRAAGLPSVTVSSSAGVREQGSAPSRSVAGRKQS